VQCWQTAAAAAVVLLLLLWLAVLLGAPPLWQVMFKQQNVLDQVQQRFGKMQEQKPAYEADIHPLVKVGNRIHQISEQHDSL
jgi:hypothetical protein